MHEDLDFHIAALLGCIVGSVCGFHAGGVITAVDGCFIGFAVSAFCTAILAELSYALRSTSVLGARRPGWLSPLITLGILLVLANRFWK
ncbi:MAG TPA: hypothetical protein VII49_00280 [Rhizomicrobium sp.]